MRNGSKMPESSYDAREPVTRRVHDRPWVADLGTADHAENRQLLVAEAVDAVEQTIRGIHVDIVTHERHGHPSDYLYANLRSIGASIEITDEGRCDCGGYVTRVRIH